MKCNKLDRHVIDNGKSGYHRIALVWAAACNWKLNYHPDLVTVGHEHRNLLFYFSWPMRMKSNDHRLMRHAAGYRNQG